MKKHNALKVVLITILVFLLLTWILPAAYYSSEYIDQGRVQMGLSELFNYPMTAVSYFGHIALYIILVGSFYGVLYKIPAYRTFLDKVVAKFEGKERFFLILVTVLLALVVSVAGLQIGFIFFVPFIISLILLMGYDKMVASMVVVGSFSVGLIGTTYSYSNLSLLMQILSLDIGYQVGVRFVILLVGIVLLLFNMFMYIQNNMKKVMISDNNVKKNESTLEEVHDEVVSSKKSSTKNSVAKKTSTAKKTITKKKTSTAKKSTNGKTRKNLNKAALRDDNIIVIKESVVSEANEDKWLVPNRVEVTHRIWPFVVLFSLMFVLVVLAFISWGEGGFGSTYFESLTEKFNSFELFGFPIFAKVYGTIGAFGEWNILDLFLPMGIIVLLLSITYKLKLDDVFGGAITGARKAIVPAAISILLYSILVIVTYHPFQMSIYKAILGLGTGFNIATTVLVTLLSSVFNIEPAYAFQAALPYYTSLVTSTDNYSLVGIIAQSMYGFASLCAPTSFVLMCSLAYLKIPYGSWLKNVWKLLLELFVILLIIFIVLALV